MLLLILLFELIELLLFMLELLLIEGGVMLILIPDESVESSLTKSRCSDFLF